MTNHQIEKVTGERPFASGIIVNIDRDPAALASQRPKASFIQHIGQHSHDFFTYGHS